jgi:hypothetical protein
MRRDPRFTVFFLSALILFQIIFWLTFLSSTVRTPAGPILLTFFALILGFNIVIVAIWSTSNIPLLLGAVANTFALLVLAFSFIYWTYGSTANFNIPLTHLDAVYFAIGTMATGTGNVAAISETSRGIQILQMTLDFGFIVFALGVIVARISSASSKAITTKGKRSKGTADNM